MKYWWVVLASGLFVQLPSATLIGYFTTSLQFGGVVVEGVTWGARLIDMVGGEGGEALRKRTKSIYKGIEWAFFLAPTLFLYLFSF